MTAATSVGQRSGCAAARLAMPAAARAKRLLPVAMASRLSASTAAEMPAGYAPSPSSIGVRIRLCALGGGAQRAAAVIHEGAQQRIAQRACAYQPPVAVRCSVQREQPADQQRIVVEKTFALCTRSIDAVLQACRFADPCGTPQAIRRACRDVEIIAFLQQPSTRDERIDRQAIQAGKNLLVDRRLRAQVACGQQLAPRGLERREPCFALLRACFAAAHAAHRECRWRRASGLRSRAQSGHKSSKKAVASFPSSSSICLRDQT